MLVKICGITNIADAGVAVAAGADYLGFVFYAPSPRCVTPDTVRGITADLPATVGRVGVFVDEPPDQVRRIAEACGLTVLQLHGAEPPAALPALRGFELWKAVALRTARDVAALAPFRGVRLVVDTPTPDHGGSGQTGDWNLAREAASHYEVMLAGGLTPANVGAAIAAVRPLGVDVSSGVERAKGLKDHALVCDFVAAARAARC